LKAPFASGGAVRNGQRHNGAMVVRRCSARRRVMRSILGRTPSVVTPWRNSTTPTNANSNRRLRLSLRSTHRFTIHAEVYRPRSCLAQPAGPRPAAARCPPRPRPTDFTSTTHTGHRVDWTRPVTILTTDTRLYGTPRLTSEIIYHSVAFSNRPSQQGFLNTSAWVWQEVKWVQNGVF